MRLADPWFDAHFIGEVSADGKQYRKIETINGAQGLLLWCPCGYGKAEFPLEGGRPHGVLVVFSNPRNAPVPPADFGPHSKSDPNVHPRWTMSGNAIEDLTLTPSVDVGKPSCWHGHITNGEVT